MTYPAVLLILAGVAGTAQAGIAYEPSAAAEPAVSATAGQETLRPATVGAAASSAAPALQTLAAVADLPPAPFSVTYKVSWTVLSGDVTLSLAPAEAPGSYTVTAATQARGLARLSAPDPSVETARFLLSDGKPLSQSYELQDGSEGGRNNTRIDFDWEAGAAQSVYEGEPAKLALGEDVYDRITADIVIINDLRNGREPRNLSIAEKNQVRAYTFTPRGEEEITVPAGTFRTIKYLRERPGSSRATLIWYAPDAGYLPVRMEQLKRGKTSITSVAVELTQ